MSVRMNTYQFLVNRVPAIQKEYWRRRKLHKKPVERAGDWLALLGMNLAWGVGYRSWAADDLYPDARRILPKEPESCLHKKEPPEEFAKRLLEHDVISFDVFDTLVLRPFERPVDLFHLVGAKLEYLDFARLRSEAEAKARRRKYREEKTYEVALEEIWDVMEEDVGIPKDMGMTAEVETELQYCFGNPYMLDVFRYLREGMDGRKTIICTSDMYLPSDVIHQMLDKCGFQEVEKVYVSCEQGTSKSDGSLYRKIKKNLEKKSGKQLTFIHTGDNRVSDVEKAEANNWKANHYPNVNDLGEWYRARDMSAITGSLYRGIVNAHIYNGLHTYSKEYELGFIYGGLFVTGYCQWIHRYVREQGIDKILFLARDGDILYQVYKKMYPEEAGKDRTEYVYWSRLAATKLGAKYFKYDYFRRFLHHKVNQGYTLEQVFASMELDEMLEECLQEIATGRLTKSGKKSDAKARGRTALTKETKLTSANVEEIEKYLKLHWQEVLDHYKGQREAAGMYYHEVLEGHRKVAAVDVGWAGSGAVVLQYLARKEWNLDCEIIGLLAGTNTVHNGIEKDTAEGLRYVGKQASYLYSQEHNREIWKFHDAAKGHNLLWELLLSSTEGSLRGFYPKIDASDEKKSVCGAEDYETDYEIRLGKSDTIHAKAVREIQSGILDFVDLWREKTNQKHQIRQAQEKTLQTQISGSDVYQMMKLWCDEANKQELERLFDKEGI